MIEPVGARSTAQLQEVYDRFAQNLEQQGPGAVLPGDQQRFEAAMAGPVRAGGTPPPASMAETQVAQVRTADPWVLSAPSESFTAGPQVPTLGERILDGMTDLREGWNGIADRVQEVMSKPNISLTDAIDLQVRISQTTLMVQAVSQEVGTVSQKIDGLLKSG